ncbi:hypothetical protein APHAL10511_005321 [Amanita phalloides]|nr:hypothetical protein APHAL10511_005321 [Amanita phalloides]
MTRRSQIQRPILSSSASSLQEIQRRTKTGTDTGSGSDTVDVALDLSSIVLTTLKDVAQIPPVPFLSQAAGVAVDIIAVVQKARNNKGGFKGLAEDSCELVYAIIRGHKNVSKQEDVPSDLSENLQQLVNTLISIHKFAKKGATRNFFIALLCSGVDAGKIQYYREKLQQSVRVFGLQSDISLRDTVAKLASQQVEMMKDLMNRDAPEPSGSANGSYSTLPLPGASSKTNAVVNSPKGQIKITTVSGDMVSTKTSKTTTNTNSHNTMMNSTLNAGNSTTRTVSNNYRS